MSRAAQEKISKLRALAEHKATPESERENALKRIEEIEVKLAKERHSVYVKKMPTSMAEMANRVSRNGLANFKKHMRKAVPKEDEDVVKDEWPFGWTKKAKPVEYEDIAGYGGDNLHVSWKCPECGAHTTKILNSRQVKRLEGQEGGLDGYIEKMTNGTMNQLCHKCWEEWNNK